MHQTNEVKVVYFIHHVDFTPQTFHRFISVKIWYVGQTLVCFTYLMKSYVIAVLILVLIDLLKFEWKIHMMKYLLDFIGLIQTFDTQNWRFHFFNLKIKDKLDKYEK